MSTKRIREPTPFSGDAEPSEKDSVRYKQLFRLIGESNGLIRRLQSLSNTVRASAQISRSGRIATWWEKAPIQVKDNIEVFRREMEVYVHRQYPKAESWLRRRLVEAAVYRRKRCYYYLSEQTPTLTLPSITTPEAADTEDLSPPPDMSYGPVLRDQDLGRDAILNTHQSSRRTQSSRRPGTTASRGPAVPLDGTSPIRSARTSMSSASDEYLIIPEPPESAGSRDRFQCPYCNFTLGRDQALELKWRCVNTRSNAHQLIISQTAFSARLRAIRLPQRGLPNS